MFPMHFGSKFNVHVFERIDASGERGENLLKGKKFLEKLSGSFYFLKLILTAKYWLLENMVKSAMKL